MLAIRAASMRDVLRLWPALDFNRVDATFPAWLTAMTPVVERGRRQASELASLYLRAHRLEAGIADEVTVRTAAPAPARQVTRSMHYTTVEAVKVATRAGQSSQQAMASAQVQTMGSVERLVTNAGRETVMQTAVADSRTVGWQRVTSGGCDFCKMLAGRGDVYTESSSAFRAHDHCRCSAEPVYDVTQRNAEHPWRPAGARRRDASIGTKDIDAGRTVEQLQETLAGLERSLEKFSSPGTRARVEDLRRKIAAR